MSDQTRSMATEGDLSNQQGVIPGKTRFYGETPAADVYYYEYFDGGMVLTHEAREKIGSPENAVRIEIEERYEPGFSRRKLAATGTTRKDLLTSISTVVLVVAVAFLTVIWNMRTGLSNEGALSILNLAGTGLLVSFGSLMVFLTVRDLRRLYRLRAIGRSMPVGTQTPASETEW